MSATHEAVREYGTIKTSSNRSFGLVVGGILLALAILRAVLGDAGIDLIVLLSGLPGVILVVLALVAPQRLEMANHAWARLGILLARIVNPIILFAVFILTIVPIGLVMRMTGKRPLTLSFDKDARSYWIERSAKSKTAESLRNQF